MPNLRACLIRVRILEPFTGILFPCSAPHIRHSAMALPLSGMSQCCSQPSSPLLIIVPKGFFPEQDTGRLTGVLRGDQAVSFQTMQKKLVEMIAIVRQDPDVENVIGFTGAGSGGSAAAINTASVYVNLKPLGVRKASANEIIARLRPRMA